MNIIHLPTADEAALEAGLKRMGYDTGATPGYGPLTRAAIAQFAADVAAGRVVVGDSPPTIPPATVSVPQLAKAATKLGQATIDFGSPFLNLYETVSNRKWAMAGSTDRTAADRFPILLGKEGWVPPESYCVGGAKAFLRGGFAACSVDFSRYASLITLGAVDTFNRAQEAGLITKEPLPGALMLLRHGSTGDGHAGIVIALVNGKLKTLECNTTPGPSSPEMDRNGGCVSLKTRDYDFTRTSGLWLMGFINPPQ